MRIKASGAGTTGGTAFESSPSQAGESHDYEDDGRMLFGRTSSGRRMTPQSPSEALQPELAPPPPPRLRKRRTTLSAFSGFLSLLVIISLAVLAIVAYGANKLSEPGPLMADKVIFISPHTDPAEIIEKLDSEGVIDSPLMMNAALVLERKRGKLKAGEYLFKQHATLRSVIDLLVSGKQILHPITIPEGLTSAQIVERLRESDVLVGEIRVLPNEGELLPETYKVARGMSRADLINKMEADQRRVVEQIWSRRAPDLPLRSPFELVTLASMVEKETGKADERPRVAAVFINRLKRHMRLQSDPTIVYGLVQGQGTLGHSITRAELDKRTPYNTYQIDGLPPGPIANPGRAALEAVANPSRTQDLYFVADGTGGHAFAQTIEDHNRNVQRWREIERDAKAHGDQDKGEVDKVAPTALPPAGRSNQRSDAEDSFGTLPVEITPVSHGRAVAFSGKEATQVAKTLATMPPAVRKVQSIDVAQTTASLDQLGFSLQGVHASASDLLDGPPTPDTPATAAPAAVPSAALAYTGSSGAGKLAGKKVDARAALDAAAPAGDQRVDLFADPNPSATPAVVPTKTPPEHPKIYDVSEGTALDPLKNRDFDLNSGKTVPAEYVGK